MAEIPLTLKTLLVLIIFITLSESSDIDGVIAMANHIEHHDNPTGTHKPKGWFKEGKERYFTEYDIMIRAPSREDNSRRKKKRSLAMRNRRSALNDRSLYWTGGKIPYSYGGEFSAQEKAVVKSAIDDFNSFTCLEFVERTNEADYINIVKDGGCWSEVGRSGGKQDLSLSDDCVYKEVVIHEFMHAAGLHHHHSRPDRDQFVTINKQNIPKGSHDQFNIEPGTTTFNIPYDYLSVMHYGRYAFSKKEGNLLTIVTKNPKFQEKIGEAPTLSYRDIRTISVMYKCADKCSPKKACAGGFQAHDCSCYCPGPSNDRKKPVVSCGSSGCTTPNEACGCTTASCQAIANSQCNSQTKACDCIKDSVLLNGACVKKSSISCTELDKDCKCSLNAVACSKLGNSLCQSNKCVCKNGYQNINNKCVKINEVKCEAPNQQCACEQNTCSTVSNSECKDGACVCQEDFYPSSGSCVEAPMCTTLGVACECQVQGSDSCDLIESSECDWATKQCKCSAGFEEDDGECRDLFDFFSDGASLGGFYNSPGSSGIWTPTEGSDADEYDIDTNNKYLLASGYSSSQTAILETEELQPGTWCVNFGLDMGNALLTVETDEEEIEIYFEGEPYGVFIPEEWTTTLSQPSKMSLSATAYNEGRWSVSIDPLLVFQC